MTQGHFTRHFRPPLVVIDDLDCGRAAIGPDEADAPLTIDADAVLTSPVALECFQTIARRNAQELQRCGGVQLLQFSQLYDFDIDEASDAPTLKQRLRVAAAETLDHGTTITAAVISVNRCLGAD